MCYYIDTDLKAKVAAAEIKYSNALKDAEIERMKATAELEKKISALEAKIEMLTQK